MDINIIWNNEDTETLETLNDIFNLQEVKTMINTLKSKLFTI